MNILIRFVLYERKHMARCVAIWLAIVVALGLILMSMPANQTLNTWPAMKIVFWAWAAAIMLGPYITMWMPENLFPLHWERERG